jgi:hypothetical protein
MRKKYDCKRCTNPICKNCSVKEGSGLLCKNCSQSKKNSINRTLVFLDIPDKVLVNVFQYIDLTDLPNLAQTCKKLWKFTESNAFWKKIFRAKWKTMPETKNNPYIEWRAKCISEFNWNRGKCTLSNLKGNTSQNVNTL